MSDLRQRMQFDISCAEAKGEVSASIRKIKECLNCIDAFIAPNSKLEYLQVLQSGWLDRFERFMLSAPISEKGSKSLSAATALYHKRMVVRYCRKAIKQFQCPNLNILQSDEIPPGREIKGMRNAPDRKTDMERLLSSFHLNVERLNLGLLSKSDAKRLHRQTLGMGYALLSVLLCGVGYQGLGVLLTDGDQNPDRVVTLPHLGADISLPEAVVEILTWVKCNMPPASVVLLEQDAKTALSMLALDFMEGFDEPFTQWIELFLTQRNTPMACDEVHRLIDRLYSKAADDGSINTLIQRTFEDVVSHLKNFSYSWYCIRATPVNSSYNANSRTDESMGARLLATLENDARIHPFDSFCPRLKLVKERNGRKEIRKDPLWDSLLFIKVNTLQIEAVNRFLMSIKGGFIYGIYGAAGISFSKIREQEITIIRNFFDTKQRRKLTAGSACIGSEVRINTGLYEGYDGTIVKVVYDSDRHVSRLILKMQAHSGIVTYSADPDYLELTAPSPALE